MAIKCLYSKKARYSKTKGTGCLCGSKTEREELCSYGKGEEDMPLLDMTVFYM